MLKFKFHLSCISFTKCKRVTITIKQKFYFFKEVGSGSYMSSLATEFQVGKTTVYGIKNSKDKIITFVCEAQDVSSLKNS